MMRVALLVPALLLLACSSDPDNMPDKATGDAGQAQVVKKPPTPAPPPRPPGTGLNVAPLDAGAPAPSDAGSARSPDAGASGASSASAPARASAFDRILAKPKDAAASPDELRARVEKATGQKVELVRKSARTWLLFQFAPRSPPRDDAAQRKLMGDMKDTGLFDNVDADRLMKVQ